jgi:hypothetical protein
MKRRSGRAAFIVVLLLAVVAVVAVAWNGEWLTLAMKMEIWNKQAPARVAVGFLQAAKSGDRDAAERFLSIEHLTPITKNGKWLGYTEPKGIVTVKYLLSKIIPKEIPANPRVEFNMIGDGAADIWIPDVKGKEQRYRAERRNGDWRLTEIGGAS